MQFKLTATSAFKYIFFIYLSFIGLSVSHASTFDQFVLELIDKKIKPDLNQLNIETENFSQSVIDYCESQTGHTREKLVENWSNAYLTWKKVQLFGFGPTGSLRIQRQLDFWPTRYAKIKSLLAAEDLDTAFKNSGVSVKGFPAIEWLIFKSKNHNNNNYCQLLLLLSDDMLMQVRMLNQTWQNKLTKINNVGDLELNPYIYSSKIAEEFINALVVGVYMVRKKSLITPMGITTGFIDINRMEATNSGLSTVTFQTRLNSIVELFNDKQFGLIGWLKANKNQDLAEKIQLKVESIQRLQVFIDDNFSDLIKNQDKRLTELESQMNDLQFIIEEDLSTAFNLIMFFKDLDGD